MRRRTKRALKKKARKHGLFAIALAVLLVVLIAGLVLAPSTVGDHGSWHLPQVQPYDAH